MAGDDLKLIGAITEGSGTINEDGFGYLTHNDDVSAAWVFDGVTGINNKNYVPVGTDAAWLVGSAHTHLLRLAKLNLTLQEILSQLVCALIEDWKIISATLSLPENYDPPAACLILTKCYEGAWQAVRLGDSCLMAKDADGRVKNLIASPNKDFDSWLTTDVTKRRRANLHNTKELLAEFRPQLLARRKLRNSSAGYGVLESNVAALNFAEYLELGHLTELLICTDGFFRAVDCYNLYDEAELLGASQMQDGVEKILLAIRNTEAADPSCETHPRFKPADDATAVCLGTSRQTGAA